jgi:hypothetical protein
LVATCQVLLFGVVDVQGDCRWFGAGERSGQTLCALERQMGFTESIDETGWMEILRILRETSPGSDGPDRRLRHVKTSVL